MTNVSYDEPPPPEDHYGNVTQLPMRPQANLEAEAAIITTVLRYPEAAPDLLELLNPDDFHNTDHETIWAAYQAVLTDGLLPDHVAVNAQLAKQPAARRPRLEEYLADTTTPTLPTQADYYAGLVRTAALARRATSAANRVHLQLQAATDLSTIGNAIADGSDIFEHVTRTLYSDGRTDTTPLHVDLSGLLTGGIPTPAPPTICRRQDGTALFYASRVNGIYGDPEALKSWITQMGMVEAITSGGRAAYFDVDHNGQEDTASRLVALGAPLELVADPNHFRYYEPNDRDELLARIDQAVMWEPTIAVLDSLGELLPMYGASSVDNDEITDALRHLATPLANAGACVITIDHLPKGAEARTSGYAIGGTAKKRAMDGAMIHATSKTPAAPGKIGRVVLRIEKDRPGQLRAHSNGKYAGTFTLDATNPAHLIATIGEENSTNTDGTFRPTVLMERVSRYLEETPLDPSGKQIRDTVKGNTQSLGEALQLLVDEGYVSRLDGTRGQIYHSVANYRQSEDDHA